MNYSACELRSTFCHSFTKVPFSLEHICLGNHYIISTNWLIAYFLFLEIVILWEGTIFQQIDLILLVSHQGTSRGDGESDKEDCIPKNLIPLITFFSSVHPAACPDLQFVSHPVVWRYHVLLFEQVLGVTSKELIPKGTRFGPLVGESYTNEILLKDVNRKYFWRVSKIHVNVWMWACVLSLNVCVFQHCSHPVSPSVAMAWHELAVVVNIWHPVKVWHSLPVLRYL